MGLLSLGTPLHWDEAKQHADHVRSHGITQFLNIWNEHKHREGEPMLWGDEIEYMVVSFDNDSKAAKLSLRQSEILNKLQHVVSDIASDAPDLSMQIPTFHPEFGRYMLESTPGAPYSASLKDLLCVELNMRYRRKIARGHLKPHEVPITLTSFPRLGCPPFLDPHAEPRGDASRSLFLPDQLINPHVRFPTLAANIRRRRGSKVAINVPVFFDTNTPRPFIDPTVPWDRDLFPEDAEAKNGAALPDHIYMDAMGFGMGCSCLQITVQASDVHEAFTIYDALAPVAPIMLALTAASPAYRGYLADVDCRWNIISASVDDRTPEERGMKPLKTNRHRIPKSRYDSIDSYLSPSHLNRPEYNDNPLPLDEGVRERLMNAGIEEPLANHIAHLFIRDPIVIFSELLDQDDSTSSDHFENIQSTNWQTLRFKPPPPNSPIGWRVEFRSMEVQLTDFENAAFSVFIVLLVKAILKFGLNFYLPMSKVDENMQRAQVRNAAREQKFFFRKDVNPPSSSSASSFPTSASHAPPPPRAPSGASSASRSAATNGHAPRSPPQTNGHASPVEEEYEEMTLDEILNGNSDKFPGLLGLVNAYLDTLEASEKTLRELRKYLDLIKGRADGTYETTATWIRKFVRSHPAYAHDSVVSQEINYDLCVALDEIERGVRPAPTLLPPTYLGSSRARDPELVELCASSTPGHTPTPEAPRTPRAPEIVNPALA